jgi:hypothetical protein
VGKLSLPGPLLRLRGPSRLNTDVAGFEASGHPCTPVSPCTPSAVLFLPPSLCLDKKEKRGESRRGQKKEKGNTKKYQSPEGATLASFLSHGRAGLDSFHRHAKPSTKTREAWVYGSGGA